MNNVVLIGRLTKDPELAYGGQNRDIAVCRFTLAVDRPTQDKAADFIRIVVFRKQAERTGCTNASPTTLTRSCSRRESSERWMNKSV